MKRFTAISLIVASLVVTIGMFVGGTVIVPSRVSADIPLGCAGSTAQGPISPEALANCPVCYQREPKNLVELNPPIVTKVLNCAGNPNFIEILKNVRGSTMNARTCYIIQAGVHGITGGDAFGSQVCNDAENARIDKTTPAPGTPAPGGTPGSPTPGGGTPSPTPSGSGGNAGSTGSVAPAGPDQAKIDAAKVKVTTQERIDATNCTSPQDCISKNPLVKRLGLIFDVLSAVVAMAVIGAVIVGGIRYSASGGDPNGVAKAKKMITNALLAFAAYIFLYAFLQWLVPGGLF